MNQVLIGIDGGATKVAGALVIRDEKGNYKLDSEVIQVKYHDCPSYSAKFQPIKIDIQIKEAATGLLNLNIKEERQGIAYAEACEQVIIELFNEQKSDNTLIGLGMPGMKSPDKKGIEIMNNGPRIPRFLDVLNRRLEMAEITGTTIRSLGEDNDHCGLGELYSEKGSFKKVKNGLYIGGGTGIADAIILEGKHIPFSTIRDWMPRTWQINDEAGLSYEYLTSHSGIMKQYAEITGKSVHDLKTQHIYPDKILQENDRIAKRFIISLTGLILKRIHLLYKHKTLVFEKVICALRLGTLLQKNSELFNQIQINIWKEISESETLDGDAKRKYLENELLIISHLIHAPIIGAGVNACHAAQN